MSLNIGQGLSKKIQLMTKIVMGIDIQKEVPKLLRKTGKPAARVNPMTLKLMRIKQRISSLISLKYVKILRSSKSFNSRALLCQ